MHDPQKKKIKAKRSRRKRAHLRLRSRIKGTPERPRLAVNKSLRYIEAQLIDDLAGVTLAAACSREADLKSGLDGSTAGVEAAKAVGKLVAERGKDKGIEKVVFDRGGFIYHGKVKAIADAAREAGLRF
jgi:large subunit ribosomal protein L18